MTRARHDTQPTPTSGAAAVSRVENPNRSALAALSPEHAVLVEAIAARVVEILDARDQVAAGDSASSRLLTVGELAAELGVHASFVYEHQDELGVIRLGGGSKPRLRFDLERAKAAVSCSTGGRSQAEDVSADGPSEPSTRRGQRRLPNGLPKPGSVLAIRGGRT